MNKRFRLLVSTALLVFGTSTAHAAAVMGGATVVQPTIPLGDFDISASPFGRASVGNDGQDDTVFRFGITGGDLDGLAGTIEHAGSGVNLSSGDNTLSLRNFLIDTTNATIFSDVYLNDTFQVNAGIFNFDVTSLTDTNDLFELDNPMLALTLSTDAAQVLDDVFELNADVSGAQFGLAATAPSAVPLPGALLLFGSALTGLIARKKMVAA